MNIKRPPTPGALGPLLASVALFGLLCAIVAYWGITLLAPASPVAPVDVAGETRGRVDPKAVAELFGALPGAIAPLSAAPSNIQVLGITAGDPRGSAILTVDGGAGRFYPVGARLSDGAKLIEVKANSVIIERAGARSELPAPPRPSIALLSAGKAGSAAAGVAGAAASGSPARGLPASAIGVAGNAAAQQPAPPLPPAPPFGAAAAASMPPPTTQPAASALQPGSVVTPPAGAFNPNIAPMGPGQIAPNIQNLPNQPAFQKPQ